MFRTCAIGDFVVNLPALVALSRSHPDSRFTLVGNPSTLALARPFVDVEAIGSIDSPAWRRLYHSPADGLEFDRAIVWSKDPAIALNLRRSGIPDVLHADPFPTDRHAADHLLATWRLPPPELPDLWRAGSDHIILHPGSGSAKKNWPHFLELAERLGNAQFLIGPAESNFDTERFRRIEALSLSDVFELLRIARTFVGNDSGITHLAAYLGCPTIAIFTSTDPVIWGPIGRRVRILQSPVVSEVARLLSELPSWNRRGGLAPRKTDPFL